MNDAEAHAQLHAELRLLAELLRERLDAWLANPPDGGSDCGWCPLCAAAAAVRGEPGDAARRWAERAAGLLTGWLAGLETPPHDEQAARSDPGRARRVHPVVVRRGPGTR